MSDLVAKLDAVKDERSFTEFLYALAENRRNGDSVSPWQWDTIEDFLEAAGRWAEDSENGLPVYKVPINPWQRAADILFSGKVYE